MEKKAMIRGAAAALAAMLMAAFPLCSHYPVDTSGRDIRELESVWQYLKVYSIWQDSIPLPADVFNPDTFRTPEQLLASVHDTFYGFSYTRYEKTASAAAGSGSVEHPQAVLPVPLITAAPVTDSTAYLRISTFDDTNTYESFLAVAPYLSSFPNLIIDLRFNTGGYIDQCDSIIEHFLPAHTPYIRATYRMYDNDARTASTVPWKNLETNSQRSPSFLYKRIAVLMNKNRIKGGRLGTASASEIMAAGLKDGRAGSSGGDTVTLVGDTSEGKGMGQIRIPRSYLGKQNLQITYIRLQGVTGRIGMYHRKGISPDILVANPMCMAVDSLQYIAALNSVEPKHPDTLKYVPHICNEPSLAKDIGKSAYPIAEFEK
jgi:hypothetical protein